MPRIDADTVAEHRAHQHEALLAAAEALLVERGYDELTFAGLGARTGLARSSVYRYFASRDDIVAQIVERDLPAWMTRIRAAVEAATTPEDRVAAFVSTQLALVAGVRPELFRAIGQAPLGPTARSRISAMNYQPAVVLEAALVAHGHPEPQLTAHLVQGLVNAAVRLLHHSGRGADDVAAATVAAAQRCAG